MDISSMMFRRTHLFYFVILWMLVIGSGKIYVGTKLLDENPEDVLVSSNINYFQFLRLVLIWTNDYLLDKNLNLADGMVVLGVIQILVLIIPFVLPSEIYVQAILLTVVLLDGVLASVFFTQQNIILEIGLNKIMSDYSKNNASFSYIQRDFNCCGVKGVSDLRNEVKLSLIESCAGTQGCLQSVNRSLIVFDIMLIVVFFVPLCGIMWICWQQRQEDKRRMKEKSDYESVKLVQSA